MADEKPIIPALEVSVHIQTTGEAQIVVIAKVGPKRAGTIVKTIGWDGSRPDRNNAESIIEYPGGMEAFKAAARLQLQRVIDLL